MSILEIIGIVFLCLFSLTCFAVAFILGAWWYIGTGSMTALLALAIYSEDKTK